MQLVTEKFSFSLRNSLAAHGRRENMDILIIFSRYGKSQFSHGYPFSCGHLNTIKQLRASDGGAERAQEMNEELLGPHLAHGPYD